MLRLCSDIRFFRKPSLDPQVELRALSHVLKVLSPFSRVQLFATLWAVARQAPLSKGLSRQEYWSGLPCPLPRDLPDPGMEPTSPALAGRFFNTSTTWEATYIYLKYQLKIFIQN